MPWGQRPMVIKDPALGEVIAIRDGSRGNSNAEMVKVVKPYTPAEIEAVSDYMSQMAPPKP